ADHGERPAPLPRDAARRAGARRSVAVRVAVHPRVGAAEQDVALDDDGLAGAELDPVVVADDVEAEPVELTGMLPEPALEIDASSLDAEAGLVQRLLGVDAVVDERRDELDVPLRLHDAAD